MKKILIFATISLFGLTNAQLLQMKSDVGNLINITNIDSRIISKNGGVELTYEQIQGSPYTNKNFMEAKVGEKYKNEQVRYNALRDEVEFKEDDDILLIPKDERFSRITFIPTKEILVYEKVDADAPMGYYFELAKGKISLYKKLSIKFSDFQKAESSYKNDEPAAFYQAPPDFYIKDGTRVLKTPKKEKEILQFFPDKKDALNGFFKQNRIKLDKEADLIKLVNFLNQ